LREQTPEVGLIVKFTKSDHHWEDKLSRAWDGSVRFTPPDTDVFAVNVNTLAQTAAYPHVGATLFNMATNPKDISFLNFAPAFQALAGSAAMPPQSLMQEFANFQLSVLPPPNPVRNPDNSLTISQSIRQAFFSGARPSDGLVNLGQQTAFACNECHVLNPANGSLRTAGNQSFGEVPQIVKIPHLR
jgi:hypothetical protein